MNHASPALGFDGFVEFDVSVGDSTVHGRRGGTGPPLLLLHGIPQTHSMWGPVASALAATHTVVATDLRGFGASGAPASSDDHAPYAMRTLAREQVEVMAAHGFSTFAVAGHDRGARCAYRMALDHPGVVRRLAVLDVVPTLDAFERADARFALDYWVWSFLAAPYPVPEELISASPATLVDHMLDTWSTDPQAFTPAVREEYTRTFRAPERVHAVCEQYRAAATLDCAHDRADLGRRQIDCPVLVLWDRDGAVGRWYDPTALWRRWAADVSGHSLAGGHFLVDENPEGVLAAFHAFFD